MSSLNYGKNYIGLIDDEEIPHGYDKYYWISERNLDGITWCERNNRLYEVIPKNWSSNEEIESAEEYISNVKQNVVKSVAVWLNDYHHVSYSIEAWNVLLGGWLDLFLETLYDKYLKLLYLKKNEVEGQCNLCRTDEIVVPLDYAHAADLMYSSDIYHFYLYSQIVDDYEIDFQSIQFNKSRHISLPVIDFSVKPLDWQKKFLRGVYWAYKKIFRIKDRVIIQGGYLPYKIYLKAMLKSRGKITAYMFDYNRDARFHLVKETDIRWRTNKNFEINTCYDEFTRLACRLVKKNIPIAYVEGFSYVGEVAKKTYGYSEDAVTVIMDATGISSNEVLKRFLMDVKINGGTICGIQHGGGYGMQKSLRYFTEFDICDKYYTWGWKRSDSKFVPMPMPKGFKIIKQMPIMTDKILYVNYIHPKNVSDINLHDYLGYRYVFEEESFFLNELYQKYGNNFIVRLSPEDCGWKVREKLDEKIPNLCYDENSDFYLSLSLARLVILEYSSTTLLEALVMNKPFIVRCSSCILEKEAVEDFELMKKMGIMYDSFGEMMDVVDDIYSNIEVWWNDSARQKAIHVLKNKYAYFPNNAEQVWIKEIMSYL